MSQSFFSGSVIKTMLSYRLNGAVYVSQATLSRGVRVFEHLIFSAPIGQSGGSVSCGLACCYTKWNLDTVASFFLGPKIMDFVRRMAVSIPI